MHRHSGKAAQTCEVDYLARVVPIGMAFCLCLALLSLPIGGSASLRTSDFSAFGVVNGKIAFSRGQEPSGQIYVMDADGSNQTNVSNNNNSEHEPAWSPDGTKIVYATTAGGSAPREIWTMNADGSGKARLYASSERVSAPDWAPDGSRIAFTLAAARIVVINADGSNPLVLDPTPASDVTPSWSPDSTKIAFMKVITLPGEIWVMNADGTNVMKIAGGGGHPAWSPDGTKIAFIGLDSASPPQGDIYVMNVDGSGQTRLTTDPAFDFFPAWSPDGSKIVFPSNRTGNSEIFVMNTDGSNQVNLTNNPAHESYPAWQRILQASAFLQFSSSGYSVDEGAGFATITVTRTGDTSSAATVSYATSDSAGSNNCNVLNTGVASSRCDYETTVGTLHFAAGETSKTISVPVINDSYAEGSENFTVTLSNASGANLGSPSTATVTITDNETVNGTNPIDQTEFFVRQHYVDFFTREPDSGGLAFWKDQIDSCTTQECREIRRINVSAAFFLSIEFQQTGYLVERLYKTAYGDATGTSNFGPAHQLSVPIIRLNEFLPDTQQIGSGVVIGQPGADQLLESNKQTLIAEFVQRSRFTIANPLSLTPAQFVDALNTNAANVLSTAERDQLVSDLSSGLKTRAQVLRAVAEDADLFAAESNRAFVLAQYFGYLRRNPNDAPDSDYSGYDFWLTKLNQFNGNFVNAEMVKAFIISGEYRERFGP